MKIFLSSMPVSAGGPGARPSGAFKDSDIRVHACIPTLMRRALQTTSDFASHLFVRTVRATATSRCLTRVVQELKAAGDGGITVLFQATALGDFHE